MPSTCYLRGTILRVARQFWLAVAEYFLRQRSCIFLESACSSFSWFVLANPNAFAWNRPVLRLADWLLSMRMRLPGINPFLPVNRVLFAFADCFCLSSELLLPGVNLFLPVNGIVCP